MMNLIDQAENDLSFTLEDKISGFGVTVVLISPDLVRYGEDGTIKCQSTDIGFRIEPGTDIAAIGRQFILNFRASTLLSLGVSLKKGWQFEITGVNGDQWTLEIKEKPIDRKIGVMQIVCGVVNVS